MMVMKINEMIIEKVLIFKYIYAVIDDFMLQRYKIFFLFILVLNNISCNDNTKTQNMGSENNIKTGDKAPLFVLPDQNGKMVNLNDFIGVTKLVIYFYPKDESYGCTKEACSFRDSYEDFKDAGAEVIGISADDEASHKGFAANHKLPFILLADKDKKVARLYGVGKTLGILPGRVTFIIDKKGIIRGIYSSQINYQKHVEEALEVLRKI
jgi:thioredoxin-dependent peroxiredoxin